MTGMLSSEVAVPHFLDLSAQRPKRASKAFQAALKIDPHLTEARFQDARIRAEGNADARTQLEQLSAETGVIAYLAAMSRAETARALDDMSGAGRWYERAVSPSWNALASNEAFSFDSHFLVYRFGLWRARSGVGLCVSVADGTVLVCGGLWLISCGPCSASSTCGSG